MQSRNRNPQCNLKFKIKEQDSIGAITGNEVNSGDWAFKPKQEVEARSDQEQFRLLKMENSEGLTRFPSYQGW